MITKLSEACDKLVLLFQEWSEDLGLAEGAVFYGDQTRIPNSPAVCVEPNEKQPELYGAGRLTKVNLQLFILVYHSEMANAETNRRAADRLGEEIADRLNAMPTFFGEAIHCWVSNLASGYSTKQNSVMRAVRVTFDITIQERLPNNP